MVRPFASRSVCYAFLLLSAVAGCASHADSSEESAAAQEASNGNAELRAIDDCEPTSFGALCNPAFHGGTTLAAFQAELAARMSVGKWKWSSAVNTHPGSPVNLVSRGGETHTFTIVKNFGGGRVPALNTASGNPIPAPECLQPESATNITVTSGVTKTITTGNGGTLPPGHYKGQCCIHPWMRTEIDVR